jgi:3-deoxy-D-manno-octulosonic-acid transferase
MAKMSALFSLYRAVTRVSAPVLGALLHFRLRRGKEDGMRIGERRGVASRARPHGPLVWIHAASVGEAQSALILLDSIKTRLAGAHVMVTTGTLTSAVLMERRLPAFAFHHFVPLDHPAYTARFLDHWHPDLALWMESELWPNMLHDIARRGIPAILLNARLSDRSFARWGFAPGFARQLLSAFSLILAQSKEDARRFESLGAANVAITNNIKYSASPLHVDDLAFSTLRLAVQERPLWVYASTHAGEEKLGCDMHKRLKEIWPDLLTILVPRHPERREDVAAACFESGLKFALRSQSLALPGPDDDIYIADTLGELGLFYALSPISMIGRSFSNDGGGGHNPVEAAQFGCAVLTGPNNQYQRGLYDGMAEHGAVLECKTPEDLFAHLRDLLANPGHLDEQRKKSRTFVENSDDVITLVLNALAPYLKALEERDAA